jgi:hypothetical protein
MEDLNKLELPKIKTLCKQYDISVVGDKKSLNHSFTIIYIQIKMV